MTTNVNKHPRISFPALLFVIMSLSFLIIHLGSSDLQKKQIIDGDGSGYYAYLPSLLIYQTVNFKTVLELEKQKRSADYQGHYFHNKGDILVNKYSSGTALLQLPFFLLAYLLSLIFGLPPDGYNILFQYGIAISALFYTLLGLLFFKKLAGLYNVSSTASVLMAFAGLFGTNLFYYTFMAPSMSHAYSFSMVAVFLYCVKSVFLKYSSGYVFVSAFFLGLIVLIRPVNFLVVLAIPFIASNIKVLYSGFKKKAMSKDAIIAAALFMIAISPQLIINYLQTDSPFAMGYENEGFYWGAPEVFGFLFGFRKGWFIYTPLMLLLVPATIYLFKRSKYEFVTFLIFLFGIIYVFSAWWNWFYGDSFGMRPMIDFYAILFLVISLFLNQLKKHWLRIMLSIFICLSAFLNIFQSWQYYRGILHVDSMNYQAYFYVFLRTDDKYVGSVTYQDEYYYGTLSKDPFHSSLFKADQKSTVGWSVPQGIHGNKGERPLIALNQDVIYSPTYRFNDLNSLVGTNNIYVKFHASYLETDENAVLGSYFVVDISDKDGKLLFYKAFRLKSLPDEVVSQWREGSIGFKLPEITTEMKSMKLYVWNKGKKTISLDNMRIGFYTYSR